MGSVLALALPCAVALTPPPGLFPLPSVADPPLPGSFCGPGALHRGWDSGVPLVPQQSREEGGTSSPCPGCPSLGPLASVPGDTNTR